MTTAHANLEGLLYISGSKMNQYTGNVEIYTYILGTSMYIYNMYIYTMYIYAMYIYDLYIYICFSSTVYPDPRCSRLFVLTPPINYSSFLAGQLQAMNDDAKVMMDFFGWIGYFL